MMEQNKFEELIMPYVDKTIHDNGTISYPIKQGAFRRSSYNIKSRRKYAKSVSIKTPFGEFSSIAAAVKVGKLNWTQVYNKCIRKEDGYQLIGDDNEEVKNEF